MSPSPGVERCMETIQDVCPPASPVLAAKVVPPVTPAMLAEVLEDVERWDGQKVVLHWVLSPDTVELLRGCQVLVEHQSWKDGEPDTHEIQLWAHPVQVDLTKKGHFGALVSMHVAV